MSKQIIDIIRSILMEEDQVCLPGIGTLRLSPQAALISPIEGKAMPPSERVNFNANLVLDDGRVLRGLTETTSLDHSAAQAELTAFLAQMKENLDAGRSVTLDGVGRLFRHFDGQLRFTPGGDNFSKDSFGLPSIDIRPIVRTERNRTLSADPLLAGSATPSPGTAPAAAPKNATKTGLLYDPELRKILWYVAAFLGAITLLCLLYLLGTTIASALNEEPTPIARKEEPVRIPPPAIRTPRPPVDADRVTPEEPPRLQETESSSTEGSDQQTEPPTTPPANTGATTAPATTGNVALIATGLYGSSRNVEKNMKRIKGAGYEPFSMPDGRYTRVGVRLNYSAESERVNALSRIRRLFSEDAFVWELNGERMVE